ncbi:TPA: hypothetical protein DEQ22_00350 [Candidatus Nomurabacteria bacterium]|uniref:POTRA domain-containing protein n=2 Tax=Candidatus Nomuraibacteriota TaxID=1752729 RepID=A0A1F6YM64_9BACT|nr:MAG: hypothetical protein UV13_C0001G0084 [Parcubacteria group bacterium GW2011_GWC1_42_21]KKS58679.1 MAG: hypothetical protein UV23_C0002G0004 [Candidatus Nomurabacteria bacterium GW2011_GWF1_42_40]KKT07894.1 MAG: hypothetical protein UV85_C0003G0019 [Candidatus Nomurabacteria bacterium GW2011_GWB1_43_19]KKT11855.1 MAG: hypothetical protein UV91_C0001G0067 [Candidatus Nomurabacteria bacterium GW2011_GWF2_43_24]KKT18391.1 MAG: hypothetical protein UW01_C0001G0085 [Candidatus Nomurabacteria b
MRKNVLNSPRLSELKKRRQRVFFAKILISGLGLLVIFFLLAYLSRLESLNIGEIKVSGNQFLETETLRVAIETELAGKYLWLFPKTNILYYSKNSIKKGLQDRFKRIGDMTFSINDNETLEISLTERTPKYIWCGIEPKETPGNKCYFMDKNGYIFDEAPYFSGEVYFKFYGRTDTGEPLGAYFLKQNFRQLVWFKDFMIELGMKPTVIYATGEGDIEIFLSRGGTPAAAPKILLQADADFQNAAENLETALSIEPLQSKFKKNYSSLQYIDLRFENRVIYKFQ